MRTHRQTAFSLLELILTISVLGVIALIAIPQFTRVPEGVRLQKLNADVAAINKAITVYRANGGVITASHGPAEVIAKLKTQRAQAKAHQYVGFRENAIDPRLEPVFMTGEEAEGSADRAVWDASTFTFVVQDSGAGIKQFNLTGDGQMVEEVRNASALEYSDQGAWIWDYKDGNTTAAPTPTVIATTDPSVTPGTIPDPELSTQLSPPRFSVSGGNYPLNQYDLQVSLINPNNVGSQIYYRFGQEGSFQPYDDEVISIGPSTRIEAYVVSRTANYTSSRTSAEYYDLEPEDLELALNVSQNAWSYFDLLDGNPVAVAEITNAEVLEGDLSGVQISYTNDGSDPSLSPTRLSGSAPVTRISFGPDDFQQDGTLQLGAQAASDRHGVGSSTVQTLNLVAQKVSLEAPGIQAQETEPGTYEVTMTRPARYPEGMAILYTLDGSNPTLEPLNGILYEDTFTHTLESTGGDLDPGSSGVTDISRTNGIVPISQVVLETAGKDVVQNQPVSGNNVNDRAKRPVNLKSVTITENGQTVVADQLNVLSTRVSDVRLPDGLEAVNVIQNGKKIAHPGDPNFVLKMEQALSSSNLRDYIDYGASSVFRNTPYDFVMSFDPLLNSDLLVVMERNGNSHFELTPVGPDGELLNGGKSLRFQTWEWNTGFAPENSSSQPFYFTVVDVESFGVNTNTQPITGFRVNNDGQADFKFWTISDEPFEDRVYAPAQLKAVAFPPSSLTQWFEQSSTSEAVLRTVEID